MIKLTVAIITLNEEKHIRRCLQSLQGIADEILVVDSFSTDKTELICHEFNVRFIKNKFMGYIEQKNFALKSASHDHILSLDADEALSDELLTEIKKIKNDFSLDGYYFNRLTNYCGKFIYHCGWYPDKKLRLFKKSQAKWQGTNPHDILAMHDNTRTGFLKGDLLHYSYESITSHIAQTNKFTTIAAQAAFAAGNRSSLFKIISRPTFKFLKDYILNLGFLDGRYGFVICFINSLYSLLKFSKLYELQSGKEI